MIKASILRRNVFCCLFCIQAHHASASWSMNAGYHNPPGASLGINFLYMGSQWAWEGGLGWVDLQTSKKNSRIANNLSYQGLALELEGAMSLKYFFTNGNLKPYLQGGLG